MAISTALLSIPPPRRAVGFKPVRP